MLQPVLERGLCVGKQCRIISYIIYNYKKDQKKHNKGVQKELRVPRKRATVAIAIKITSWIRIETERPSPNNKITSI